MVFRRRSGKGNIIDSVKHEIRYSNLLEAGAGVKTVTIATAKNTADLVAGADTEVKTGSLIKAIFFELNWNVEGNITSVVDWCIFKAHPGQNAATNFNLATPNQSTRSQVFLWGMEMPAGINNSASIKRIGTLLIPKGKQRMSEGDFWQLSYFFSASGSIADSCGHFIFKEYR